MYIIQASLPAVVWGLTVILEPAFAEPVKPLYLSLPPEPDLPVAHSRPRT